MADKPHPPRYSSFDREPATLTEAAEEVAHLDLLIERSNNHFTRQSDSDYPIGAQDVLDRETERIRNMLKFTLSVDYGCNAGASISAADREHFIYMADALRLVKRGPKQTPRPPMTGPRPRIAETLTPYFTKFLLEPCKALQLPIDCVYTIILFLSRYTDRSGAYKGALMGQLHDYGLDALAVKFYMDRSIIVPRVFANAMMQAHVLHAVNTVERKMFFSISGIETSAQMDANGKFRTVHSVTYEATKLGLGEEAKRKQVLDRVCNDVSVTHWAKAVMEPLASLKLMREEQWKSGGFWKSWLQRCGILSSQERGEVDPAAKECQSGL